MMGFIVIAFGIVLTIRAGIGLSPWGAKIGLGTLIYLLIGNAVIDFAIYITKLHPGKVEHITFERYFKRENGTNIS